MTINKITGVLGGSGKPVIISETKTFPSDGFDDKQLDASKEHHSDHCFPHKRPVTKNAARREEPHVQKTLSTFSVKRSKVIDGVTASLFCVAVPTPLLFSH